MGTVIFLLLNVLVTRAEVFLGGCERGVKHENKLVCICQVEPPEPGMIYTMEQELIVATTPHEGDQYDLDNERVYGIIKQLILEGPAWAYIPPRIDWEKDGCAA